VPSPHPFTFELRAGDVVWSVKDATGTGDHLCVVRVSRDGAPAARGAVSRSFPKDAQHQGAVTLEGKRLILTDATRRDHQGAHRPDDRRRAGHAARSPRRAT